jgi:alpha-tubulin suppressor-like RCC1 family protein
MEGSEACDGQDFGDKTCDTELGLEQGQLACTPGCELDRSGCFECGNGSVDGPEECDGDALGGASCESLTGHQSGSLACTGTCTFDVSACHTCGDGIAEGSEECDATDLAGASCSDLGFDGGTVTCDASCVLSVEGCYACGDGACEREKGEGRQTCLEECGWSLVSAGGYHTCALTGDGRPWCFGQNSDGQLGRSTATGGASPVAVVGLGGLVEVSSGNLHTCGIDGGGSVWCWGNNEYGQLGDGTTTGGATPVMTNDLADATELGAGSDFTCARTGGGDALCWGANVWGQLGDGTTMDATIPVEVLLPGSAPVVDIAAGAEHACALDEDSLLWCWGRNNHGQLGDGTTDATDYPILASALHALSDATPVAVSAGDYHTCIIDVFGGEWCWGRNDDGQLGCGDMASPHPVPQPVTGLSGVSSTRGGWGFTCAISSGELFCWGDNQHGQLGSDQTNPAHSDEPLAVGGINDVGSVSTGGVHACALLGDRTMWCWGDNASGQIGAGSPTQESATPLRVLEP